VAVLPHATHGQVVRVTLSAPAGPQRQALEAAVHQALGPLALHHEVA
jgi:hypothetical protein